MPGIALVWLALMGVETHAWQSAPAGQAAAEQYFSGAVVKTEPGSVTVTRTVLGKQDATRTFLITPETRTEGKLKVNARVTVKFVESEQGDRAVHILVRAAGAGKK